VGAAPRGCPVRRPLIPPLPTQMSVGARHASPYSPTTHPMATPPNHVAAAPRGRPVPRPPIPPLPTQTLATSAPRARPPRPPPIPPLPTQSSVGAGPRACPVALPHTAWYTTRAAT